MARQASTVRGDAGEPGRSPGRGFALAERPGYLLHKAALLLDEEAERAFADSGMRTRDFFVLAALAGGPALSQQDLSRLLNLDPTTVVAVVDELEDKGYVERRRNPADRRRYILGLTDAGRTVLADAERVASEVEAAFFDALSKTERDLFRDMLGRVMAGRWPESVC